MFFSCVLSHFSRVQLFVAIWTVACQTPLSIGFSRQEYWNGLPFPSPICSSSYSKLYICTNIFIIQFVQLLVILINLYISYKAKSFILLPSDSHPLSKKTESEWSFLTLWMASFFIPFSSTDQHFISLKYSL